MKHARCLNPFFDAVATYVHEPEYFANLNLQALAAADPKNGTRAVLATLPGQFHQVDQLVEQRYAWRGYRASASAEPAPSPLKRKEITFVTQKQSAVTGTLAMHFENGVPLQADKVFSLELDAVRQAGGRPCEVTRLAIAEHADSRTALGLLFRLTYLSARVVRGMTHMFIEVNPRHASFYRLLNFDVVSSVRICERVLAPAVLLRLDYAALEEQVAQWSGYQPLLQAAA